MACKADTDKTFERIGIIDLSARLSAGVTGESIRLIKNRFLAEPRGSSVMKDKQEEVNKK
jgi:hypothetical protein